MKRLRIAMIGSRGVPARWGGVERHVEELGAELVRRGHQVTVFCRSNYGDGERPREHRGMRLEHLPTVGTKHLDAIVHSALSTGAAMAGGFDVLHYHALGPGACALLPRCLGGARVVLTVHGLDDQRAKWGGAARRVLRTAGWLSARVPDATIVVSRDLARHYRDRHGRATAYVPNGAPASAPCPPPGRLLETLGLRPRGFLLFVGRFVPEKAPDLLLRAFGQLGGQVRLALVGDSSFSADYLRDLRDQARADGRVVFTGFRYGAELDELYANAAAFVLPSLLEGLPLTLLEAAVRGTPVVASAIPPHVEVIGADGPGHRMVPPGDRDALVAALRAVLEAPARERDGALRLGERVRATYRWETAAAGTEEVYRWALERRPPAELAALTLPVPKDEGSVA